MDPLPGTVWEPVVLADRTGLAKEWRPGHVTVATFYALWCDTWKVQEPRFLAAQRALAGLDVDFLAISMDGRWKDVPGSLPLLLDSGGEWSRRVGVDRVPTTVVLDATGTVRWSRSGTVRSDEVADEARKAMKPEKTGPVYLTFDDFPPKAGGAELLDRLEALGVQAGFFCLGSRVEANASLLRRCVSEGHQVGCHSWDHDASSPQLDRCREVFRRLLGLSDFLYRPPGSEAVLGVGKHFVVDPYDYQRPGVGEIERRVLLAIQPGAIIQLHAGVGETLEALPTIVANLQGRGFRFELLTPTPK
jgi:peptidoglycan/xylan/chitin deacetylase (PgdA/CDA1 family)